MNENANIVKDNTINDSNKQAGCLFYHIEDLLPSTIECIVLLPKLIKLLVALFYEPRVPKYLKIFTAGVIFYTVVRTIHELPLHFEKLPKFVTTKGGLSEITVIFLILLEYMKACPEDVLKEHWEKIIGSEILDIKSEIKSLMLLVEEKFQYTLANIEKFLLKISD